MQINVSTEDYILSLTIDNRISVPFDYYSWTYMGNAIIGVYTGHMRTMHPLHARVSP